MMTSLDTKSCGKNNTHVSSTLSHKFVLGVNPNLIQHHSLMYFVLSHPNSPRCLTNSSFSPGDETDNHPVRHHHRPSEQGRHVQPVLVRMSRQLRQRTDLFSSCEMDGRADDPFSRPRPGICSSHFLPSADNSPPPPLHLRFASHVPLNGVYESAIFTRRTSP